MKRFALCLAVLGLMAAPALANFGTIELKHTNVSPSQTFTIRGPGFEGGVGAQTGVYHHQLQNSTTSYPIPDWGFCIELQQSVGQFKVYDVVNLNNAPMPAGPGGNPMGVTKADFIRELWAEKYSLVENGGAQQAAAFQLAIWEIVYEDAGNGAYGPGGWDVKTWMQPSQNSGVSSFKASNGAAADLANTWLSTLDGQGQFASLVALTNLTAQDYVVRVPAPAAALLGLLGLGGLGWVRRKLA